MMVEFTMTKEINPVQPISGTRLNTMNLFIVMNPQLAGPLARTPIFLIL
jgi:hypothetical protein